MQAHVWLGYAATEHGHQSDTVTTAIVLASLTTTRRGLYVAATRGRDRNELCVITDSKDIAEARDVLEAVLAFDRADIPAVTQRRNLAQAEPRLAPPRHRRRARQRRRGRIGALCPTGSISCSPTPTDRRRASSRPRRERAQSGQRLIDRSSDARTVLRRVDNETAAARTAYAAATRRVEHAEVDRRGAARLLDESGWRRRRHARHDLADADAELADARSSLEHVRTVTDPDRQRHRNADTAATHADDELHRHQLSRMLRPDASPEPLHHLIAALETWRRWAAGAPIPANELADALAPLRDAAVNDPTGHLRTVCVLVDTISPEAATPAQLTQVPAHRRQGPSLGL